MQTKNDHYLDSFYLSLELLHLSLDGGVFSDFIIYLAFEKKKKNSPYNMLVREKYCAILITQFKLFDGI